MMSGLRLSVAAVLETVREGWCATRASRRHPNRNVCLKSILESIPGMVLLVYPSELTDAECAVACALLPPAKRIGRLPSVDGRLPLSNARRGFFFATSHQPR